MNNQRIAAVMFPNFSLELFLRTHPDSWARSEAKIKEAMPLVLAESESDTATVIVVSEQAAEFGITTGMTIARANSYCPDLVTGIRNLDRETKTIGRMYQALQTVGPDIECGDGNDIYAFCHRESVLGGCGDLQSVGQEPCAPAINPVSGFSRLRRTGTRPTITTTEPKRTTSSCQKQLRTGNIKPPSTRDIASPPRRGGARLRPPVNSPGQTTNGGNNTGPEVIFYLEASGLNRLYGNEEGIARAIFAALTSFSYPVTIGIADNKLVGRIATIMADMNRYIIVPPDDGDSWLRSLHLSHLSLPEETTATLHDLGIDTIGQAAAFPANEITRRFGRRGRYLTQAAQGNDPDFFIPRKPTEDWRGSINLDFPIRNTETILGYTERILKGLLAHLHRRGLTCPSLNITLELEDHRCLSLIATTEEPTCSAQRFLRQLRSQLEQLKLTSSVTGLAVVILHTNTRHMKQLVLEQQGVRDTIDPLTCDSINRALNGSPLCHIKLNTGYHLPESNFFLTPISLATKKKKPASTDTDRLDLPPYSRSSISGLRLIRPPQPTDVYATDDNNRGKSLILNIEKRRRVIRKRSGPWKLSGGWWRSGFDRFYYEFQTEDNHRYLVFFDRTTTRWFLQGVYD